MKPSRAAGQPDAQMPIQMFIQMLAQILAQILAQMLLQLQPIVPAPPHGVAAR